MSNTSGGAGGTRPEHAGAGDSSRPASEGRALTFEFKGQHVGYFEAMDAYPSAPGKYRYMPYRGIGHLKMIEECARAGMARCTYAGAHGTMEFTVRTAGEYGMLEISEISEIGAANI